ncbi:MAG TPA: VanZ family protein [Sumerlaeia bacterium]|nr:VanZ family protein [Sumerlaeia bacterium]
MAPGRDITRFLDRPSMRALAPIVWGGLIFLASSIPGKTRLFPTLIPHSDKIVHAGLYAVLGWLLFRAGKKRWTAGDARIWMAACCLLGSLYGASDEWHQLFVPDRACSLADWIFDSAGTVAGVVWRPLRARRGGREAVLDDAGAERDNARRTRDLEKSG